MLGQFFSDFVCAHGKKDNKIIIYVPLGADNNRNF